MKAVLLVAGLGTRLRPLTEHIPKCLLPINGVPLLSIWFDKLLHSGVSEVLVNTHWLPDQVRTFVADHKPEGLEVSLVHEPELLGSGGTLLANREFFGQEPFMIIYGDNLSDVDLADLMLVHNHYRPVMTLGTFAAEFPERCGIAEVDSRGVVTSFVEKPENPISNCAAAGIYAADQRLFNFFPKPMNGQQLDLGFDVIPRLVGQMRNYEINKLIDIGTPESYRRAQAELA